MEELDNHLSKLMRDELRRMKKVMGREHQTIPISVLAEAADFMPGSGMYPRSVRPPEYDRELKERKKNYQNVITHLKSSAEAGDVEALTELGMHYYYGKEVDIDLNQSSYYYEKAAKAGDAVAMYALGLYCLNGIGFMSRDVEQAIEWFQKAGENGYPEAWAALGELYDRGKYVERDYAQALAYYTRGAEVLSPQSMLGAAKCYEYGYGTDCDEERAFHLYQRAYERLVDLAFTHDVNAYYLLGRLYFYGIPLIRMRKSLTHAFEWFERAAEEGHTAAQNNLSLFYRFGLERPKDEQQAPFQARPRKRRLRILRAFYVTTSRGQVFFSGAQRNNGTKDDKSNTNVTFGALFPAETLKKNKFPPKIFLNSIIICIFATAN